MYNVYTSVAPKALAAKKEKEVHPTKFCRRDQEGFTEGTVTGWANKLAIGGTTLIPIDNLDPTRKGDRTMDRRLLFIDKQWTPDEIEPPHQQPDVLPDDGQPEAKRRQVANGALDPDARDIQAAIPAVTSEEVAPSSQILASYGWVPWFLNSQQAFVSGDEILRRKGIPHTELLQGGVPGVKKGSLIQTLKRTYGFASGHLVWNCNLHQGFADISCQRPGLDLYLYRLVLKTDGSIQGCINLAIDGRLLAGKHRHAYMGEATEGNLRSWRMAGSPRKLRREEDRSYHKCKTGQYDDD